jgi:phosphoglycolate phosphatase
MRSHKLEQNSYLLLFDLDGTLMDTTKSIELSMNEVRVKSGYKELETSDYIRLVGKPVNELLSDLKLHPNQVDFLVNEFRTSLCGRILANGVDCFDGVLDTFIRLENLGIQVGVATSKPSDLAKLTIDHSILKRFKLHIQGTDGFPPKPSPIVISKILFSLKPDYALMVGDRTEDIQAARRAGVNGIGIAAGFHSIETLLSAGALLAFSNFLTFSQSFFSNPKGIENLFSRVDYPEDSV